MKLIAPQKAVPTHIISGFLGAGKTTLLKQLLSQKPEHEVWAVLMNEFGQIGVDQQLLPQQQGYQVKELLGKPNYKNTNENVWTYEAGTGGGFGFVDHFLEIYYKKNKVQKIEHKRIQD